MVIFIEVSAAGFVVEDFNMAFCHMSVGKRCKLRNRFNKGSFSRSLYKWQLPEELDMQFFGELSKLKNKLGFSQDSSMR